ncbi:MAG: ribosome biogenesis GTPase YlqF [Gammaproteobacteria bacterium]|nr:ribosome biogenesis GTPase YlqF [Gammaproteobacteria bacterium]
MTIGWFPGHMHKASKELDNALLKTHVIIEVLDARAPVASTNPRIASMRPELPRIRILNKSDLAQTEITQQWQAYFDQQDNSICLSNTQQNPISARTLIAKASDLVRNAGKIQFSQRKNQIVIGGIPNVGKSTLLNQICERKLAKTGNEPAVTLGQQRVRLSDSWILIDTPGLLWPKLTDQHAAYLLAAIGTIRNTAIDAADIAFFLAEHLSKHYQQRLFDRYRIVKSKNEAEIILSEIANYRGSITNGGKIDWNKTAEILLNDFRTGKLGRFSLERPPLGTDY